MRGSLSLAVSAAAAMILLGGCALKKPPDADAIKAGGMAHVSVPSQWAGGATEHAAVVDDWLSTFHDPQLSAAVAEAIANNSDLRVAATRVEQARLYAKLAGADLYPSVDLIGHKGIKMGADGGGLQGALINASWEIDLWGRVRYAHAAATADYASAQADFEYARQSLAAAVAKNWFLATEAGLQADIARATIQSSEELVRLAESRSQIGAGNDEDVYLARASVGSYRDALRQIELSRSQAIRALEMLMGRYPSAAAAPSPALPGQPDLVPAGLPSELLERRPDVIAAERRVAAAFNRVHEAKAARLPAISLTGGVSSISSDLFVLQNKTNPVWSLGANLLAPIYKGGALQTQVKIRTEEQRTAVATYAAVGLRAFGDVESALAAENAAHEREQILTQVLADNQRAFDLTQTRYRVGNADLRDVTRSQLALSATQASLTRMQAERRIQRVNLYLALGGSFEVRPVTSSK